MEGNDLKTSPVAVDYFQLVNTIQIYNIIQMEAL